MGVTHQKPADCVAVPPKGGKLFSLLIGLCPCGRRISRVSGLLTSAGCALPRMHSFQPTTTTTVCTNTVNPNTMAQSQSDEMSVDKTEKSERVVTYLTPDKKSAVETASGDQSVASWVRDAINQKLKNDQQEEILNSTNAEQRIRSLVAEASDDLEESTEQAADQIRQATQQYHQLLAVSGVYNIASFRLLGDNAGFTDGQRRTAIDDAVARLNEPDTPALNYADLIVDETGNDARASESRAEQNQEQQPQDGGAEIPDLTSSHRNDSDDSDDDDDNRGGIDDLV